MRRVGFAAAIAAIFVVNVANAGCYGTDTFQNCDDNSGNQGRRMKSARHKRQHALVIPGGLLATSVHADPGVRSRSQALSIPIGLMQLLGRTVTGIQIRMRYLAGPVSSSSNAYQFQRKASCTTLQSDNLLQRYP